MIILKWMMENTKYVALVDYNVALMIIEKGMMGMKDKLVKGQAFIGIDDNKYYFLGLDYDDQILFTSLDLWTEIEQKYMALCGLADKFSPPRREVALACRMGYVI